MRIIFFCPTNRRPVGGIKVIYRLASLCNEMLGAAGQAVVLHPNRPWTKYTWFDSRPKIIKKFFRLRWTGKPSLSGIGNVFDKRSDIVILPEIWVRKYGPQLAEKGIAFAIFVQGGYLLAKGNRHDLDASYAAAKLILAVSENTASCIAHAFPFAKDKIRKLRLHIESEKFSPAAAKKNVITYMPRKLPDHIKLWKFFLENRLPLGWTTQAIDNQDENGVAQALAESKIFVSMSYLEGLGLPPIEAALAGNVVIGYTGEGGKEYWKPPLFREVEHGNLLNLVDLTVELTRTIDFYDQQIFEEARVELAHTFSRDAFNKSAKQFLDELLNR